MIEVFDTPKQLAVPELYDDIELANFPEIVDADTRVRLGFKVRVAADTYGSKNSTQFVYVRVFDEGEETGIFQLQRVIYPEELTDPSEEETQEVVPVQVELENHDKSPVVHKQLYAEI